MRDLYDVLGVRSDTDRATIQDAFRRLARKHHPDFGGDPSVMAVLNEAWAVLGHERRRAAYNASRNGGLAGAQTPAGPIPATPIAAARARNQRSRGMGDASEPGSTRLDFGRYAGWTVEQLAAHDPDYLEWLARVPIGRGFQPEINAHLSARRAAAGAATATRVRPTQSRFRRQR